MQRKREFFWVVVVFVGLICLVIGKNWKSDDAKGDRTFHYPPFQQLSYYEEAFEKATLLVPPGDILGESEVEKVKGIVVNHHLLVPEYIANALVKVSGWKPKTVILISPNHFAAGDSQIITSLEDWKTPYGILETDKAFVNELVSAQKQNGGENVLVEEAPFKKEHGINNIVSFIKKVFPETRFVPLIVKDNLQFAKVDEFVNWLKEKVNDDVLVIASFDFAHYLPSQVEDFQDTKSLAILDNFDLDGIKHLNIDSKPGLRMFMQLMRSKGALNFRLFNHSNSAKYLQKQDLDGPTSYITGSFLTGEFSTSKVITMLMVPDAVGKNLQRFVDGADILLKGQMMETDYVKKILRKNETLNIRGQQLIFDDSSQGKSGKKSLVQAENLGFLAESGTFLQYFAGIMVNNNSYIVDARALNGLMQQVEKLNLALGIVLEPKRIQVYLFPLVLSPNKQLMLPEKATNDKLLSKMAQESFAPETIKQQIREGHLSFNFK